MNGPIFAVGSTRALNTVFSDVSLLNLSSDADVVVLPTAASFTGAAEAAVAVAQVCGDFDVRVEALMVTDRTSSGEPHFVQRLSEADVVVVCDGASLHARTVWRNSPVGDALQDVKALVAIGSVASVFGEVMIDPRGGAPTNGLGLFRDVVITTEASGDQLQRTRSLLSPDVTLAVLGANGVVSRVNDRWRALSSHDILATRGFEVVAF